MRKYLEVICIIAIFATLAMGAGIFSSGTSGTSGGSGSGDMVGANNLSDVASVAQSATNLGLGTGNSPTFQGLTSTTTINAQNVSANFMGKQFAFGTPTNNDVIYFDGGTNTFMTKQSSVFQSGSGQILYHWPDVSDVPTCSGLEITPTLAVSTTTLTTNSAVGTGNADNSLGPIGGFGVTTIPAGLWQFSDYVIIDSTTGVSKLVHEVWTRTSGGVETKLFEFVSAEINNTAEELIENDAVQQAFTIGATDRILLKHRLLTTSVGTRTLTITEGGSKSSHMHTPLGTEHDSLTNIKGTGYYHLSSAENTVVTALQGGNISISGTITANAFRGTGGSAQFTGITVAGGTVTASEIIATGGITLGGVRNTAWPASGGTITQSVQFAIGGAIATPTTVNILRDYGRTAFTNTMGAGTLKSFAVNLLKVDTGTKPNFYLLQNGTSIATQNGTAVGWNVTTNFTTTTLLNNDVIEFGTGAGGNLDSSDATFRFTFTQP